MDYSRLFFHPEWSPPAIRSAARFLWRKCSLYYDEVSLLTAHPLELFSLFVTLREKKLKSTSTELHDQHDTSTAAQQNLAYYLVYDPNNSFYKNTNEITHKTSNQTARKHYCWLCNYTFHNFASFSDPYTCHYLEYWCGSLGEASSSQPHFGMASEWESRQDAAHPFSVTGYPADGCAVRSHKALQYFVALVPCRILPHLPPAHLHTQIIQDMHHQSTWDNISVNFAATYLVYIHKNKQSKVSFKHMPMTASDSASSSSKQWAV